MKMFSIEELLNQDMK